MSQGKNLGMQGGKYELVIVDEDSKINANLGAANDIAHIRLAQEIMSLIAPIQYSPLFEQRDGSGQFHDRVSVCQALIDWADMDELGFNCDLSQLSAAQNAGVEDAWYQLLPKPYRRKNAPYDSLNELHMVRGMSEDFWSTFVDPDPSNPKKRVMTVWGQGMINVNTANAQTLLGVVCAGAPTADICTNPEQAAMFLTGVTMARGITMGAPMFGSTRDFVQAMSGAGQLGPMLAAIGMKPVTFKSQAEFQKSITTESKMFSIYAVGVKKGYRRETRVKVHAVVDFRNAPNLSAPPEVNPATGQPVTPGTTTTGTLASGGAGATDAIAAANQPSTGGTVVYFRVE
jgi:general secretion pathway protein K